MSSVVSTITTGLSAVKSAAEKGAAKSSWVLPYVGWTYKALVADKLDTWVGRNLNWIAWSPANMAQSTIHQLLHANQTPPTAAPTNTYHLSCLELPLLAAWMSGAILATKTGLILADPEYQLSVGWAKRLANGSPKKGDLVTWRARPSDILVRAFGGGPDTSPPKLGLAHVTVATGINAQDGSPQVISFWGDYANGNAVGPVERTSVAILSGAPGLNGCEVIWGPPNW